MGVLEPDPDGACAMRCGGHGWEPCRFRVGENGLGGNIRYPETTERLLRIALLT
jgi:hypothetical protein